MLLNANRIGDSWRMWLSLLKALVLQDHSVEFSKFAGHLFSTDCQEKPLPSINLLKCIFLIWLDLMNLICYQAAVSGFYSCCFSCSSTEHRHPQGWHCDLCTPNPSAESTVLCVQHRWLWGHCSPWGWQGRAVQCQLCSGHPSVSPGAGWTGGSWMDPWTELLQGSTTVCGRSWREPPTAWSWQGGSCPR